MCDKTLLVPIPEFLRPDYQDVFAASEYGPRREFDIDVEGRQCEALWAMGVRTTGCCCGHGSGHGVVSIEVPNGGDVLRRDKQTRYFYERMAADVGGPPHLFRGSNYRESNQAT